MVTLDPCSLLLNCKTIHHLSAIHTHLILTGLVETHHHLALQTIHHYLSFGLVEPAVSTYRSLHKPPPLPLQNSVIRCLSSHGHHAALLSLYSRSQRPGSRCSDNYTYPFVLKACAALPSPGAGKEVHCAVLRTGHARNAVVQTALVDMYAKTGRLAWSRSVFDGIPDKDLVSWNAMISGYASNGYDREALREFRAMRVDGGLRPSASTFVSVVPLGASKKLGRSLHCFALKLGFLGDESLLPSLIMMYAAGVGLEDLAAARMLFDATESKGLVSWNAMISTYSQSGRSDEAAVEVFRLMQRKGVRPNFVTMVSVLQSCGGNLLAGSRCGEVVHATGIKLGLTDRASVVTSLVTMYGRSGEMNAAKCLFDELSGKKNLLLYNSMVSACLHNWLPDMGLAIFHDTLLVEGLLPDAVSVIGAISACSMSNDLRSGKSAHAYSLRRGFDSNTNVMNTLLALYSDCDCFNDTLKLFSTIRARNAVTWNTVISGWAKIGDTEASVASFQQMQQKEVEFDSITMISMVANFNHPEDLYQGMTFHSLIMKVGYESDTSLKNALITMYMNCGDVEAGSLLFESLSSRGTVVSWNALLTGYRKNNLLSCVMNVYDRMRKNGQKPNSVTLLNLLPSCETELQGKSIHGFAVRNFTKLEPSLLTSTMCMYARFENFSSCSLLFEMVDKKNTVSWNTAMSVYVQSKDVELAVASFKKMLEKGLEPDAVTMLILASACSQTGSLVLAQCVTSSAIRRGFEKNTAVINAFIDMHARCGSLRFARELFDGLEAKDSITWSSMINACGMHGEGEAAISLFSGMQESGVEPDGVSFVSILSACSHAGLVEQGRQVFESMAKVHGIEPRLKHFACMVDLLGRSGHLDEAYSLVKRLLPTNEPCATAMLESLLGACRSHSNAQVGEAIGELVLNMRPRSAGSHVLLSNIYAATERWRDSGKLRSDMDERGLKKDPGFSLIGLK